MNSIQIITIIILIQDHWTWHWIRGKLIFFIRFDKKLFDNSNYKWIIATSSMSKLFSNRIKTDYLFNISIFYLWIYLVLDQRQAVAYTTRFIWSNDSKNIIYYVLTVTDKYPLKSYPPFSLSKRANQRLQTKCINYYIFSLNSL